jgi:hypothetical protein
MLILKRRNIAQLPFEVLEQAHWRPREMQLCCKHKPEGANTGEFRRLRKLWRQREINFNFALDALLMCCDPSELSGFASGLSGVDFDKTYLLDGYCQQLKKIIGVPDFVLSDKNNCILGENKVSAVYEFTQFIKYQTFGMLCRSAPGLPNKLMHIIVVPDPSPARFLSDYGKAWSPNILNNDLILDDGDQSHVFTILHENIDLFSNKLQLAKDIKASNVLTTDALKEQASELMQTKVYSWKEFVEIFDRTAERPDLSFASQTLFNLGMGKIEIDLDC